MFNKIVKAITGYNVQSTVLNGIKIKTKHRGRLSGSDPLLILKDAKIKLQHHETITPISFDLEDCWRDRLRFTKDRDPNSISTFRSGSHLYSLKRYAVKQDNFPLSLYTLSCDTEILAIFSRVYDSGKFFEEVRDTLIPGAEEGVAGSYAVTNGKYGVLLDVLGHSQSFLWNDKKALTKCLESLGR